MNILIKNGHVLDPGTNRYGKYDVYIHDNCIEKLCGKDEIYTPEAEEESYHIVDAKGMYVMPGFIDLHVHFREPGFEYKETIATGSRAAARGGYTAVCTMPNTKPVTDSPDMIKKILEMNEREGNVRIYPVGAVTKGQQGQEPANISGMVNAGAKAISEDGKSVMDVDVYRRGMRLAKENHIPVFAHCEDIHEVKGGVMNAGEKAEELGLPGITNFVEDIITARDILLAEETGATLHLCHCSTSASAAILECAKRKGVPVTGEVCPHHFVLCDEDIPGDDANYKMNPPLRSKEDREALRVGLRDGIFDVISTDHAPHSEEEKTGSMKESPFGIVGLETAFALGVTHLVETGYLSPMQLVAKMSTNPAKILGVEGGTLSEGCPADIVIANMTRSYKIDKRKFASMGKNTPFDGMKVKGKVWMTILNGEIVFDEKGEDADDD